MPVGHDPNVQILNSYVDNGDNTTTLRVDILNPRGFYTLANWVSGASLVQDLGFALVLPRTLGSNIGVDTVSEFTFDVASSYYIDMNGDTIAPVAPEMVWYDNL